MRTGILLISTLVSWAPYDLNLFRRRNSVVTAVEFSYSEAEKLRQRQKIQRHHLDVIPKWHSGKKKAFASRCNYFETKPRDVRFSDQRKIRRMFNNM